MFDGLSADESKVAQALWQFRPGPRLPFPLLKLAVELETGQDWDSNVLKGVLKKIVKANILEEYDEEGGAGDFAAFVRDLSGPWCSADRVWAWLKKQNKGLLRQGLLQAFGRSAEQQPAAGLRGWAGPSALQQAAPAQGDSEAAASVRRRRQCLLAVFLVGYGRVEGSVNVPQMAEAFLREALTLRNAPGVMRLFSFHPDGAGVALGMVKFMRTESVIAAVLASDVETLLGMDELHQIRASFLMYTFPRVRDNFRQLPFLLWAAFVPLYTQCRII